MERSIYELRLHERLRISYVYNQRFLREEYLEVLRVPGGWLYLTKSHGNSLDSPVTMSMVFVPYMEEEVNE